MCVFDRFVRKMRAGEKRGEYEKNGSWSDSLGLLPMASLLDMVDIFIGFRGEGVRV